MKFVVLGPTGATGRRVVQRAAEEGHDVVAYARRPEAVEAQPRVTAVGGAVDDVAALTRAMTDADAVICCLGPRLGPGMLLRVDILQRAVPAVLEAMDSAGVSQLVLMSAFGAADTEPKASLPARLAYRTVARAAYDDKNRIEPILAATHVQVSTVYPVMLTNGPASGSATVVPVDEVDDVPAIPRVSRADVAAVLVDLAEHPGGASRRLYVA